MQIVAGTGVPHPSETTEVPHPSEMTNVPHLSKIEALTAIKVNLWTTIEETALHTVTEALAMDDMEVTPPVDVEVTTLASTKLYLHNGGFPGGPSECSVLTRYVDHVAFRLWQEEVCI
ncbi:unnamed protein product [Vicia faba]|uniref:Uncharacterized protein n=1 Tax=Vicia faba TaxID=3906 RepID=A0AAV0ZZD0_VICFA|nr:unnamed protein product [Vicia faba]